MNLLQELLLLVVAELSALDLKNTSLVSQSWRIASQRQLFRVINADLSVFDGRPLYRTLLASPHLILYIRTVSIYGTPIREDGLGRTPLTEQLSKHKDTQLMLAAALKLMTNLETLQIYLSGKRFSWSDVNPVLRRAVEDAFKLPVLRTLRLDEWYFEHSRTSNVPLLNHSAPALRRLELVEPSCAEYHPTFQSTFGVAKPDADSPIQLEELSIIFTSLPPVQVSNWLLNQLRAFDLTNLHFLHTSVSYDNSSYIALLLGSCRTSLKSLHLEQLHFLYIHHESGVDLSSLPALRTLKLQVPVTEPSLSLLYSKWLKGTLESFRLSPDGNGSGIEFLDLRLSVSSKNISTYEKSSFGYTELAMLLSDQQCFPELRRVQIELRKSLDIGNGRLYRTKVLELETEAFENLKSEMGNFLGDRLFF